MFQRAPETGGNLCPAAFPLVVGSIKAPHLRIPAASSVSLSLRCKQIGIPVQSLADIALAESGRHGFYVEGLSQHLLNDEKAVRAVVRAVKNILDYGSDVRLRKLCEALDVYREKVILERESSGY
jgi:hypothetical protein